MTEDKKTDHWEITLRDWIIIPVAALIVLPAIIYFFTRQTLYNWYDLGEIGAVGDAVGGLTAPFINLLGAILVYVAFKAQNRANRAQWSAISRVELTRQIEALLHEVSKELDPLELSYEHYKWTTYKIAREVSESKYQLQGEPVSGRGTAAIEIAVNLFHYCKFWNTSNENPDGNVLEYYKFNWQALNLLYNKLRYIQTSLKVAATYLESLENYKSDPVCQRAKAFYSIKLGPNMNNFSTAFSKAAEALNGKTGSFGEDQKTINDFFEGSEKDSNIIGLINVQRDVFKREIFGKKPLQNRGL